jgi:hypothetical protein
MNCLDKKDIISLNKEIGETGMMSNESSLDFALATNKIKNNWLLELSYLTRSLLVDHVFRDGNKRTCFLVVSYYFDYYKKLYGKDVLLFTVRKIARKNIQSTLKIMRLLHNVIREGKKEISARK